MIECPNLVLNKKYLVRLVNPFNPSDKREYTVEFIFLGLKNYKLRLEDGTVVSYRPSEVIIIREVANLSED